MHVYALTNPMILAFARPVCLLLPLMALSLIGPSTCAHRVERSHSMELTKAPAYHADRARSH